MKPKKRKYAMNSITAIASWKMFSFNAKHIIISLHQGWQEVLYMGIYKNFVESLTIDL